MSWQVLHAGKFVDASGVVVERADHEFIAASAGLIQSAQRTIARADPVPRMQPVPWEEGFHAAFSQTHVKLDGEDHTLRVIDHRAFEGPPDRPGRPYRRRTYLLRPCSAWAAADAALPLDAMADVPAFSSWAAASPWTPRDAPVEEGRLAQDLGALLQGRLHIGARPSTDVAARISAVLAALPPAVAARLPVRIGGEAAIGVLEGTASSPADAGAGQAWLDVLSARGATWSLAGLAAAAAAPWRFATPAVDLQRPWEVVRPQLAWAMQVEAWAWRTEQALAAGGEVPACPVAPSPRALQAVLPVLEAAQASDRLGPLADWAEAWGHVREGAWAPLARLLSGQALDAGALAALLRIELAGAPAEAAQRAWTEALPGLDDAGLRALLSSRTTWAQQLRRQRRELVAARALAILAAGPQPDHPFWRLREGRALASLLAGSPANLETLQDLPVQDHIARHGDAAANAAWLAATDRPGDPGTRHDALAACLRVLRGEPVGAAAGFASAWRALGRPLPVAKALRAGVPCGEAAALLPDVDLEMPDQIVAHLLASRGLDAAPWLEAAGRASPWILLDAPPDHVPHGREEAILASISWRDVPAAAMNYAGRHPEAWRELPAAAALAWLESGGDAAALERLLPTAPVAVRAAWAHWTRNAQRPPAHAGALDAPLGWTQRRAVRRERRRLEA